MDVELEMREEHLTDWYLFVAMKELELNKFHFISGTDVKVTVDEFDGMDNGLWTEEYKAIGRHASRFDWVR
jgi:hypothetical protein